MSAGLPRANGRRRRDAPREPQEVQPVARPAEKRLDDFCETGDHDHGEQWSVKRWSRPSPEGEEEGGEERDVSEVEELPVPHTEPPRRHGSEEQDDRGSDCDQSRNPGDRPPVPIFHGRLRRRAVGNVARSPGGLSRTQIQCTWTGRQAVTKPASPQCAVSRIPVIIPLFPIVIAGLAVPPLVPPISAHGDGVKLRSAPRAATGDGDE